MCNTCVYCLLKSLTALWLFSVNIHALVFGGNNKTMKGRNYSMVQETCTRLVTHFRGGCG